MANVVIAPDSFKGSASNEEIASWLREGWLAIRPADTVVCIPMADGGEGTLKTIANQRDDVDMLTLSVIGADGQSNRAQWLLLDDGSAVVELAMTSGITLMEKLNPLGAHTFGLGQLLNEVRRDPDVERIYVALGGSGSTDGGTGALRALGFKFLDNMGDEISLGGEGLNDLAEIDSSNFSSPPKGGVICLVDVSNPLLGTLGAAEVFAEQKGANNEQIKILENGLRKFAEVCGFPDSPGSGAAGGTAFGLRAGWGAKIVSGAAAISEMVGLPEAIAAADYVITGEGQLDSQSWGGKVVGYVRSIARALNKPVGYCVGSSAIEFPDDAFASIVLATLSGSREASISDPKTWVMRAGNEMASTLNSKRGN
jgi:glycerate kinase